MWLIRVRETYSDYQMSQALEYIRKTGIKSLVQFSRSRRAEFVRDVSLGVCIPTFRRPERVVSLVNSILSSAELKQYVMKIYLVDQGGIHTMDDFIQDPRLFLYHQNNLGGSGGFSRAMREAITDGCTHVLLMDDDVTVEAKTVKRVIHFFSTLPAGLDIAISGAMYSEEKPDYIYEAGARLHPASKNRLGAVRRLAGTLIVDKDDDPCLSEDWEIDYGAWFFFACAADVVHRVGFPLPLFIRGDDQEYGLRLKIHGVPTVCLPGLWVLHPSQSDKISKWHLYFHWRNVFIITRLHRKMSPVGIRLELLRKIAYRWLGGQYDICQFIWEGWKDSKTWSASDNVDPEFALHKALEIEKNGCAGIYSLDDLPVPIREIGDQRWPWWKEWIVFCLLNGRFFPKRKLDYLPVLRFNEYHWMKVRFLREYGIISKTDGQVKIYRLSY